VNNGDPTAAILIWAAVSALIGVVVGGLAAMLWRAGHEQALRVEVEVLRARIKTEDIVSSRDTLRSNSETFLQLAGERLERQSLDATLALKERQTAIESLVQPIRDALTKTETQIQSIERERIDAFAGLKSQLDLLASGQSLLSRETRNLVTALRRPDVRGQWGEITLKRLDGGAYAGTA
jgi:DNA recombination protein RmuC